MIGVRNRKHQIPNPKQIPNPQLRFVCAKVGVARAGGRSPQPVSTAALLQTLASLERHLAKIKALPAWDIIVAVSNIVIDVPDSGVNVAKAPAARVLL